MSSDKSQEEMIDEALARFDKTHPRPSGRGQFKKPTTLVGWLTLIGLVAAGLSAAVVAIVDWRDTKEHKHASMHDGAKEAIKEVREGLQGQLDSARNRIFYLENDKESKDAQIALMLDHIRDKEIHMTEAKKKNLFNEVNRPLRENMAQIRASQQVQTARMEGFKDSQEKMDKKIDRLIERLGQK